MPHLTDEDIARSAHPARIENVADMLGLNESQVVPYGPAIAKVQVPESTPPTPQSKLILVTAMTATPKGAGKTVTTIGLGQAFGRMGLRHCICLREPSIGPTLGMKGGAAGGGRAQVQPMEDINLHFTGDLHAVTSAHNLLAALVDNHVHFDNALGVDPSHITWPRVMDICDRQLRHVELGGGGRNTGFSHLTRFDITAASEVMAVLSLSQHREDLEARLGRMVVAYDRQGQPLFARQFGAVGAMTALLRHALHPNLVQTLEQTPALIHCGPFANISHGCSSVMATKLALSTCDYVITEAGFGADLGAEKFFHIKCRQANLQPTVAVLVINCPALRYHGGVDAEQLDQPDADAIARGLQNMRVHVENLRKFGVPVVVALNSFPQDSAEELRVIRNACEELEAPFELSQTFERGAAGALALAQQVRQIADNATPRLRFLYEFQDSLPTKIERLSTEVYRAQGVHMDPQAQEDLARIEALGYAHLPLCVSKTPLSLSDQPKLRGVPEGVTVRVRGLQVSGGAGYIVVRMGAIERMPGMAKSPAAMRIHLDDLGHIRGLY